MRTVRRTSRKTGTVARNQDFGTALNESGSRASLSESSDVVVAIVVLVTRGLYLSLAVVYRPCPHARHRRLLAPDYAGYGIRPAAATAWRRSPTPPVT